ncbi:hypothetical protein [Oscillibacter sp.]|uniref:hypothetical protein n=1 Tax=Oscillibacter sp. TaxID=1945593 RepID=UPI0028982799|nr:hypothetical protein [Oscillibacter sp.]
MTPLDVKIPPEILSDEDVPPETERTIQKDCALSRETDTPSLDFKRFTLGSATLGWCIFLMFLCIILSLWKPDNELLKSGFEAFKLIVMTILGFMFGSQQKT